MKRYISMFLVLTLICSLMSPAIPRASATTSNPNDSYSVYLSNDSIEEHVTTYINGRAIQVTRTTYSDNTAIMTVIENGNTSNFLCSVDYNILRQYLSQQQSSSATDVLSRRAGYAYSPMKTEVFTEICTPENGGWSALYSIISAALSFINLPLSFITLIVSIAYSNSSSPVPIRLVTTMDWYIKTLDGEFISYYCEYTTKVYSQKETGAWLYLGSESGTMESLTVW